MENTDNLEKLYKLSTSNISNANNNNNNIEAFGSISRGITVGNNQNSVLNMNLIYKFLVSLMIKFQLSINSRF